MRTAIGTTAVIAAMAITIGTAAQIAAMATTIGTTALIAAMATATSAVIAITAATWMATRITIDGQAGRGGGTQQTVPLPDALPLLLSGVGSLLLVGARRRRR